MRRGSFGMLFVLAGAACSEGGPPATPSRPPDADCDDSDPERHRERTYYTDADGDGFGVPLVEHRFGCEGVEIEGFAPNANDCDDADPSLHLERYADRDGDGYGVTGSARCVAADDPAYSNRDGDCDDLDPNISPAGEEAALDGVDSNCDGYDFPHEIDGGSKCEPPPLVEGEVPSTPDCSGPDIFIAGFKGCTDCRGARGWLQVGNSGTEAAEVEAVYAALPGRPEFEPIIEALGEVPAGSLSTLIELPIGPPGVVLRVRVAGGAEDCSPLNESFEARLWFVDCV